MRKLNTDMILGYCRGCGSAFLNKFYMNWSVIHYSKYNRIKQSAIWPIWSGQRNIAVYYTEW